MPTATQSAVHYYLWEELSTVQQCQALQGHHTSVDATYCRNALWFRGPVDGGRWERVPLHPSDAARFRCPS